MTTALRPKSPFDRFFYALSFFFGCGAVFHVAAVIQANLDPEAPPWRHLLFVGINLACIAGFLRRPLFFVPLFCLLAIQQVSSHGSHALRAWQVDRSFDAPSFGVLLVMPLTVALLIADARRRSRE